MPDFKDLDRTFAAIAKAVVSRIKKDSLDTANHAASKIGDVAESTDADSDINVLRTDKGAIVKATIKCPTENAVDLINEIDKAVKGTRHEKWSDMGAN